MEISAQISWINVGRTRLCNRIQLHAMQHQYADQLNGVHASQHAFQIRHQIHAVLKLDASG